MKMNIYQHGIPKTLFLTFLSITFFLCSPKISLSSQYVVIDVDALNIRDKPNLENARIIGSAKRNERFLLISERALMTARFGNPLETKASYEGGTWYQVRLHNSGVGWIAGKLNFKKWNTDYWYTRKSRSGLPIDKYSERYSHTITIPERSLSPRQNTSFKYNQGNWLKYIKDNWFSLVLLLFGLAIGVWFSIVGILIIIPILPIGIGATIAMPLIVNGDKENTWIIIAIVIISLIINSIWIKILSAMGGGSSHKSEDIESSKRKITKEAYPRGSRSRKQIRLFGGSYTQHYDQNENKSGHSERKSRLFGKFYTQHYDQDGRESGYAEEQSRLFGGSYTQQYDHSGNEIGFSEEKTRLFGGSYTQHYDQDGNKAGYSEKKTSLFGDEYWQHYNQDGSEKKD